MNILIDFLVSLALLYLSCGLMVVVLLLYTIFHKPTQIANEIIAYYMISCEKRG